MLTRLLSPGYGAVSLRNPTQAFIEALGGSSTGSGIAIGPDTALTYTGFYTAVRVLSEDLASLPFKVFRRAERGKSEARDHLVFSLLHDQPNPLTSSFMFRETLEGHLCTWGNAYASIERNPDESPRWLWQERPDRVRPEIDEWTGEIFYRVSRDTGGEVIVRGRDMLHIKGLGGDGLVGFSPVRLFKEAIGLGLATESHGSTFFGSGSTPGGILTTPQTLTEPGKRALANSWERVHKGTGNAHKIAVLENQLTWQQIGIPNEDSQFLETRTFQIEEMARIFRIPAHLLGVLAGAIQANIEQRSLDYLIFGLRPWLVRWEQECNEKLLRDPVKANEPVDDEFFCEFVVEGMLRGDMAARSAYYSTLISAKVMSPNEARALENMNPYEGGDEFENPNTTPGGAGGFGPDPEPEPDPEPTEGTSNASRSVTAVLADAYGRVQRKEHKAVRAAVKRTKADPTLMAEWVKTWYATYAQEAQAVIVPAATIAYVVQGNPEAVAAMRAESDAERHTADSRDKLLRLIGTTASTRLGTAIEETLLEWEAA